MRTHGRVPRSCQQKNRRAYRVAYSRSFLVPLVIGGSGGYGVEEGVALKTKALSSRAARIHHLCSSHRCIFVCEGFGRSRPTPPSTPFATMSSPWDYFGASYFADAQYSLSAPVVSAAVPYPESRFNKVLAIIEQQWALHIMSVAVEPPWTLPDDPGDEISDTDDEIPALGTPAATRKATRLGCGGTYPTAARKPSTRLGCGRHKVFRPSTLTFTGCPKSTRRG